LTFHTNGNSNERMRLTSSGLVMNGTNITSSQNGFNPTTSGWATGAAFIGTSSYGGGLSFVDGSAGYTLYVDTAGTNFRIGQGSTSGGVTNRLTIDPYGRSIFGGTSTTSTFKTPIWVQGYKAIGFGSAGSGVGGSVGAKRLDSIGNLDYSSYFAYDCHWDHDNSYWVSHRDTLSAKLIMQAGYHSGGFQFLKYAGSASATFSDSSLTELARIDADGISFNGDTATANHLDDYEEGTFTVTLRGSTSEPATLISDTTNYYTKIGNMVKVRISIENVDTTGYAGEVSFNGLPFTSANNTRTIGTLIGYRSIVSTPSNPTGIVSMVFPNSTNIATRAGISNDGWSVPTHSAGTGRYFFIDMVYMVS